VPVQVTGPNRGRGGIGGCEKVAIPGGIARERCGGTPGVEMVTSRRTWRPTGREQGKGEGHCKGTGVLLCGPIKSEFVRQLLSVN